MSQITVYTTEPCGYCRVAKALLAKRGVPYQEINLAKDPEGRAELVRLTGMMTFPQVVIDGESIGGYQELVGFDKAGKLSEFAAAESSHCRKTTVKRLTVLPSPREGSHPSSVQTDAWRSPPRGH